MKPSLEGALVGRACCVGSKLGVAVGKHVGQTVGKYVGAVEGRRLKCGSKVGLVSTLRIEGS